MSSVKSFWDGRAGDPSLDQAQVTHPDVWQRWLEIEKVKPLLRSGERVIDIGCGSGYATKAFAPLVASIQGVDFSEGMIERARSGEVPANARFDVGNVLELNSGSFGLFDTAISLRCLINLPDWETQKTALANIASVIRPGGRYIFVEGYKDGRDRLNGVRTGMGLAEMPPVWHNIDFEEGQTIEFLERYFTVTRQDGFGIYDILSRVVHPAMVAPDMPRYEAKINEVAAQLATLVPACSDLSRVLFLVLERNGTPV